MKNSNFSIEQPILKPLRLSSNLVQKSKHTESEAYKVQTQFNARGIIAAQPDRHAERICLG